MATAFQDIEEPEEEYPPEFLSFLQQQETDADVTAINDDRKTALDFYRGEPFGNEVEGRSQVVTRDVAEVVDYMTASVLRTMVSGDRVVEFIAVSEDDADAVEEANEAVQQYFMREQDGYSVLHDSLKAGLLEKTGAVKTMVETRKKRIETEVDEIGLVELMQSVTLDAAEEIQQAGVDPETGEETQSIYRVSYVAEYPCFPDFPVPNEEFLVAKDARNLEDAIYYAHKIPTTVSDLRKDGFEFDGLQFSDNSGTTNLADARDDYTREPGYRQGANRRVWRLEEYVQYDLNGDGITERLLVNRVGTQILSVTPIEFGFIEEWCPFPMPHRRIGQSLADKCMDIQLVRSVLLRQSLDNLYLSNMPRTLIHENSVGDNTYDDILNVAPGALLRWTGSEMPRPWEVPFVAGESFQALEFMAGERESRTGITRLNQGLDADALNKTATGTALMQAQGQQMEEYIARHYAEFLGRLFRKKYRLMRQFAKPFPIRVDGKIAMADPSKWPEDVRVKVSAGLGTGSKEKRVQHRMLLLSMQKEAAMSDIPIKSEHIFNSIKGLVKDLNLGVVTDYWPGPDTPEPEPQPDPKTLEIQAKAEIEGQRLQMDMAKAQADNEMKSQQQQIDAALKQQSLDYDLQAKREKAALDEQLARDKAEFEAQQAMLRDDREYELALRKIEMEREIKEKAVASDDLPNNRPGGDLDK